jgi:hypothetical protein
MAKGRQSPTSLLQSLDTVDSYLSKHPAPQYRPRGGMKLLEYNLKEAMINYKEKQNKENEDKVAIAFNALRTQDKHWARKKVKGRKTIRQVQNDGNWVNLSNTPGGWRITQGNYLNKENNPAFYGGRRKRTRKRRRKKRTKKKTRRKRHKGGLSLFNKSPEKIDEEEDKKQTKLYHEMKRAKMEHDTDRQDEIKALLKKSFDRQKKHNTPGYIKNEKVINAFYDRQIESALPTIEKSMKMGLLVPRKPRTKSAGRRTRKRKKRKRKTKRRRRKRGKRTRKRKAGCWPFCRRRPRVLEEEPLVQQQQEAPQEAPTVNPELRRQQNEDDFARLKSSRTRHYQSQMDMRLEDREAKQREIAGPPGGPD